MEDKLTQFDELCKIYGLDTQNGFRDTYIEDIKLFKVSKNEQLAPLFYNKGFSFIGHGRKIGYVNNTKFEQGQTDYLLICSPQAIECETFIVGEESLVGVYINLNINRLNRIVKKHSLLCKAPKVMNPASFSITCNNRTPIIEDIYLRLIGVLNNELESHMLGDGLLDELYYRILQSDNGHMLKQLCQQNSTLL